MIHTRRWEPCVYHRGVHADSFLREYLTQKDRCLLLIAGAGFDPRSVRVASLLPDNLRKSTQVILIREERPNPAPNLIDRAVRHREPANGDLSSGSRNIRFRFFRETMQSSAEEKGRG